MGPHQFLRLGALLATAGIAAGCAPLKTLPRGKYLALGGKCPPTGPEVPIEVSRAHAAPPGASQVSIVDVVVRYSEQAPPEDPDALEELRRQARRSGAELLGRVTRTTSRSGVAEAVLYTAEGYRSESRPCAPDEAARAGNPPPGEPGQVTSPVYVSAGQHPIFTTAALLDGAAGTVVVDCEMTEEGTLTACRLKGSIHPTMDKVILKAVQSRRYKPAMRDGRPIRIRYSITLSMVAPP